MLDPKIESLNLDLFLRQHTSAVRGLQRESRAQLSPSVASVLFRDTSTSKEAMLLLLLGLAPAVAAWQSPWGGGPLAAAVHIPPCRVGHEWEENFVTSNPEMETRTHTAIRSVARAHSAASTAQHSRDISFENIEPLSFNKKRH